MQTKRLLSLIGGLTAALVWSAGPASAANTDGTFNRTDQGLPLTNRASQTLFEVMGQPIVNFRVASGGFSPIQRCGLVQRRVQKITESDLVVADITVVQLNGEWAILAKGQLLFTACQADATYNNSTPQGLAEEWANNLRAAVRLMANTPRPEVEATPPAPEPK